MKSLSHLYRTSFLFLPCILAAAAASSPPNAHELSFEYTFDQYIHDFNKPYSNLENDSADTKDLYQEKKLIFESNLQKILHHNSNVKYDIETGKLFDDDHEKRNGHSFHMGVNQFMDYSEDEFKSFYFGYDKSVLLRREFDGSRIEIETPMSTMMMKNMKNSYDESDHKMDLPFNITDVSTLPPSIRYNQTTPVKNQGGCGSCWSFSAITALETHFALHSPNNTDDDEVVDILSTQELVSCVQNPNQCGGTGGCEGATAELAYNYIANHGVVKEEDFPYRARDGLTCPLSRSDMTSFEKEMMMNEGTETTAMKRLRRRRRNNVNQASSSSSSVPIVAKIEGYANIPSNDYKALMNAVAKHGPVVVALAASSWSFYAGGVYSPPSHPSPMDWDLNHGVVVEGYGTDEITGEDYWLVRNSWSARWGEKGYIRLKRVDPDTLEDNDDVENGFCGYDKTPLDGIACALNPDGSEIIQKDVKVCGTNGLLFDPVIPVGFVL